MNAIKNEYKKEPLRLASMCLANNIPFEIAEHFEGLIVAYPSFDNRVSDAVCHNISYGRESGLLEIMGLVDKEKTGGDEVEGWLTAEEVFMRWNEHWLKNHSKEGA
jgi:hypothetical protein